MFTPREKRPPLAIGRCLEGQGRQLSGIDDEVELKQFVTLDVTDVGQTVGSEELGRQFADLIQCSHARIGLSLIAEVEHEVEKLVLIHGHLVLAYRVCRRRDQILVPLAPDAGFQTVEAMKLKQQ